MSDKSTIIIKLVDIIQSDFAYGNQQGREVLLKVSNELDKFPDQSIFGISLEDIITTDASFPRESIISLVKSKIGEKGFYLSNFSSADLKDNWDYAAKAKEQPIIVLNSDGYELIGPSLNLGSKELLDFIMKVNVTTTANVAKKFSVSTQNASGKLKKLLSQGIIMGKKEPAESGGMEYIYRAIK